MTSEPGAGVPIEPERPDQEKPPLWRELPVLTTSFTGRTRVLRIVLSSVGSVALASGLAWVLPHHRLGVPAALYLAAVLVASLSAGLWAGVVASVIGLVAIDMLFIPPRYSFGFTSPDDVSLAVVFLLTAVFASWLLARLQGARAQAERERNRALAVATVTRALAGARSRGALGAAVVDVARPALGATAAGVFLHEPASEELSMLAASGYPAEFERTWSRFPVDALVPAAEVVRRRQPLFLGSIDERTAHYGLERGSLRMGAGSLAALPMVSESQVLGAITLSFPDDHRFGPDDARFLQLFAMQGAQALERIRLEEEERRIRERSEFLAEASAALAASLDLERTLDEVARLTVPRFADWAALDTLTEDGGIELVAVAHRDPEMVRWAWQMRERFPPSSSDETGVGAVIRTGRPQLYPNLTQEEIEEHTTDPELLDVARRLALRSVILAPLIAREKVLGAVTLIYSESGRRYTEADLELVEDLARRAATAIDNAQLHGAQLAARRELEVAEGRLRILSEASRVLGSTLDMKATLDRVASLAVEHIADSAIVYLAGEGDLLESVAFAHVDPVRREPLERFERAYQPSSNEHSHVVRAFRTGEVQVIDDLDPDALASLLGPDLGGLVAEIGASCGVAVPLVIGDTIAGVLALAWSAARRVPDADVQLAEALAARMARAIENARLYASELYAHAEVERASDRLRLVSRASELLSESLDYPAVFERLAGLVVEELADLCLIDVLEGSGDLNRVAAAHADPAKQLLADRLRTEYVPRLGGEHPVARVIRTGVPEFSKEMPPDFLRSTTRDGDHLKIVTDLGFQSFMCAPLSARGRILGTITFVSCHPDRRYDESDLSLAMDIARPAAVRIDNARLFHERDHVARSLQQILLPESLPDIPGFELAAMYRPGREGMEVGGDFYDVFLRPDGSFGIAIGDVCGHGPEAAAVMGVARQTIRVAGMNETRPSAILGVLNEALMRGGYERFVTVCDVRVLPTGGTARLTICAAGHPLPLLVRANGEVAVAGRHGTVLGIVEDVRLTDVAVQMGAGDALVMYTDGLIEWPSHEDVDRPLSGLLSSLAGRSAADITDALEAWWSDGTGGRGRDDAAVVVLRAAG